MVYWFTGKSSAGKTVLANRFKLNLEGFGHSVILFDGDEVRPYFDEKYTDEDRERHIMRIASFAAILESQGFTIIIALVSPKKEWRMKARKLFKKSMLVYVPGGILWDNTCYEEPDHEEMMCGGI